MTTTRCFAHLCLLLMAVAASLSTPAAAHAPAWQWGLQATNPTPTDASKSLGATVSPNAAGRVYVAGQVALACAQTDGRGKLYLTRALRGAWPIGTVL